LLANIGQAVFGGFFLITLGHSLGASDFGVYAALTAAMSVAGFALEFRLQDVVAKNFATISDGSARDKAFVYDLLLLELISRLVPSLCIILASDIVIKLIGMEGQASPKLLLIIAIAHVLAKSGNGVSVGLLRVMGKTDVLAAYVSADWGLRLALAVGLSMQGQLNLFTALCVPLAIGSLVNGLQVWHSVHAFSTVGTVRAAPWRFDGFFSRIAASKRLLLANVGISVSDLMGRDLDVAIASHFLSAEKVGVYKMAKSFVQMLWRAIDPIYLALMPEVQRLWSLGRRTELKTLLVRISTGLLIFSIAAIATCYAALALFVEPLLGPTYVGVSGLAALMSLWVVFCGPLIWGHPLLVAINRPELAVLGSLVGTAAGIVAFMLLTPYIGTTGAAIAWAITLVTNFVFTAVAATRYAGLAQAELEG
jgi:O-antigen/teichoic acid export membrane protein